MKNIKSRILFFLLLGVAGTNCVELFGCGSEENKVIVGSIGVGAVAAAGAATGTYFLVNYLIKHEKIFKKLSKEKKKQVKGLLTAGVAAATFILVSCGCVGSAVLYDYARKYDYAKRGDRKRPTLGASYLEPEGENRVRVVPPTRRLKFE